MNNAENVFLQSLDMKVSQLIFEIRDTQKKEEKKNIYESIPEWVTLQQAAKYKGGAAFDTFKTQYWLQPCCGLNSRKIGGRKVWKREDVIEWLSVTDDQLWEYAARKGASIPAKYEKISGELKIL
ncbi:MAG: hypothetical protein LBE17_01455 [Treponema sp.]|jgi:hypothetical protein|nr:hypothetical protein [Treponema sp.]